MNSIEAIRTRASIKKFTDQPVSKDLIEQCLDVAVWAPNHRMTEPWRFCVLIEESRDRLIEIIASQLKSAGHHESHFVNQLVTSLTNSVETDRLKNKIKSSPVLIVVYSLPGNNPVVTKENFAASCAAIQNLLLAAHHFGLGTIWRTAEYYDGPKVKEFLGIPEQAEFAGAIHMGYSNQSQTERKRTSYAKVTNWL